MGSPSDRRAPRIPIELPVRLIGTRGEADFLTKDISRGGLFIKTDSPRPHRQLLRIKIELESQLEPIEVHGMVVHSVSPDEAAENNGQPGMGVEFIAFGGAPRERWETFLRSAMADTQLAQATAQETAKATELHRSSAAAAPMPAAPPSHQSTAPNHSTTPHQGSMRKAVVTTVFPIPVQSADQLYEIYERELVAGVMFVCTPEQLSLGDRVTMRLIHPGNKSTFDLHGKVQKVHDNPQYPGLSVALRPSTMARRDKFRSFIEAGLPEEDLGFDLLEE